MSYEITGKLIEKYEEQQVNEAFKKREFVIEVSSFNNSSSYTDYIKFQLVQDKCAILDKFELNDAVRVHFNLKGRRWEKDGNVMYFNILDAWRLDKNEDAQSRPFANDIVVPDDQDVPF